MAWKRFNGINDEAGGQATRNASTNGARHRPASEEERWPVELDGAVEKVTGAVDSNRGNRVSGRGCMMELEPADDSAKVPMTSRMTRSPSTTRGAARYGTSGTVDAAAEVR
jgi:hypothetical protein